jgi:hypothetical protein
MSLLLNLAVRDGLTTGVPYNVASLPELVVNVRQRRRNQMAGGSKLASRFSHTVSGIPNEFAQVRLFRHVAALHSVDIGS